MCVVDAFTESAFKGNPAAVCLLEEERDEEWLQLVATEFNLSETCFLTWINSDSRFRLRWFTPVAENLKIVVKARLQRQSSCSTSQVVKWVCELTRLVSLPARLACCAARSRISSHCNNSNLKLRTAGIQTKK